MNKKVGFGVAAALLMTVVLYLGVPMFDKNRISGELIDAEWIPNPSGGGTLCILTDGSWTYFSRTRTAGRQSQGRKGIFCKTHRYWYDPQHNRVLTRRTERYAQLPPPAVLLFAGDMLWEISTEPDRKPSRVLALRPATGEQIMDTGQFYSRFAGAGVSIQRHTLYPFPPYYLTLTTEDNRHHYIDLTSGTSAAALSSLFSDQSGTLNRFVLADPTLGNHRLLFLITGGDWQLLASVIPQSAFKNPNYFERSLGAKAVSISPGMHFLDGVLSYQDNEIAVILHQEEMAPTADRRLTCVDKAGQIQWTLSQAQLFPGLALRQNKPFSSTAIIQNRLRIKKSGGLMLVVFQAEGWIGLDAASGRILWRYSF
jgi:hypothetical protein